MSAEGAPPSRPRCPLPHPAVSNPTRTSAARADRFPGMSLSFRWSGASGALEKHAHSGECRDPRAGETRTVTRRRLTWLRASTTSRRDSRCCGSLACRGDQFGEPLQRGGPLIRIDIHAVDRGFRLLGLPLTCGVRADQCYIASHLPRCPDTSGPLDAEANLTLNLGSVRLRDPVHRPRRRRLPDWPDLRPRVAAALEETPGACTSDQPALLPTKVADPFNHSSVTGDATDPQAIVDTGPLRVCLAPTPTVIPPARADVGFHGVRSQYVQHHFETWDGRILRHRTRALSTPIAARSRDQDFQKPAVAPPTRPGTAPLLQDPGRKKAYSHVAHRSAGELSRNTWGLAYVGSYTGRMEYAAAPSSAVPQSPRHGELTRPRGTSSSLAHIDGPSRIDDIGISKYNSLQVQGAARSQRRGRMLSYTGRADRTTAGGSGPKRNRWRRRLRANTTTSFQPWQSPELLRYLPWSTIWDLRSGKQALVVRCGPASWILATGLR